MNFREFVSQPNIIQLYTKDGPNFEKRIRDIPYIRLGKKVRGEFAVFYIEAQRVYDLFDILGTTFIETLPDPMTLLGRTSLEASTILQVHRQPALDLRGRGTLIGIIDTGIDCSKEAFQYEDGTSKIRYIWDQSIEGNAPGDYLFGSEYTNEQINQTLRDGFAHDFVPSVDTVGHGTFLASLAASRRNSEFLGAAPDAELIVVKLRRMEPALTDLYLIPRAQENVFSAADIMLAVDYMIDKSVELNMPISICIGLGSSVSGSDGYEILEQYLEEISKLLGICVCTAAGNESNAGRHASGTISRTGATYTVQVRVPENASSFGMNIYVSSPDRVSVSLKSPLGEIVPRAVAISGQRTETKLVLERARIGIAYYFPLSPVGDQFIHLRFINPTAGIWDVVLHGDIVLHGDFHAWLNMTGLTTQGIQFLTPDPYVTIVTPATSIGSITVGAYDERNNALYVSSSWGPNRRNMQKPDLVAPGVDVSGIFPMSNGFMTGTSVATAITAGACALMLQWGIVEGNDVSLNTNRIKSLLIRGCRREANTQYPSPQWGYGKLDLFNTFRNLRGTL
ncbi:MAG: S8 family peptidase [Clostridiales bacterium]|jgi:subtilisin family serine protease|nr:S8 family peptidase [Clostridiales bacterium]